MSAQVIVTVLSNIPWGAVVENAPKVADGAAKLWNKVMRKNTPEQSQSEKANENSSLSELELLTARLKAAEESVQQLNEQMQASTELIKALAEQNTMLIQKVEIIRFRVVKICIVAGIFALALLASNLYLVLKVSS